MGKLNYRMLMDFSTTLYNSNKNVNNNKSMHTIIVEQETFKPKQALLRVRWNTSKKIWSEWMFLP